MPSRACVVRRATLAPPCRPAHGELGAIAASVAGRRDPLGRCRPPWTMRSRQPRHTGQHGLPAQGADDHLEYLVLCDSPLVLDRDGNVEVITDDRLDKVIGPSRDRALTGESTL